MFCSDTTIYFDVRLRLTVTQWKQNAHIKFVVDLKGEDKDLAEYYIFGMAYAQGISGRTERELNAPYFDWCSGNFCALAPLGVDFQIWRMPYEAGVIFGYTDRVTRVNISGIRIDLRNGIWYPIPGTR